MPATPDPLSRLRLRVAGFFQERDVGPEALSFFSLALSGAAAFVFLTEHFGLGACLGLCAFLLGEVALVPRPWLRSGATPADLLNPAGEVLVTAGIFGGLAVRHPPVVTGVALLVLAATVWLPRLRVMTGASERGGPWHRGDRAALLLVGMLLGRPGPALLVVAVMLWFDVRLRLRRLAAADSAAGLSKLGAASRPHPLLLPDGELVPLARWASLAVCVVALFFLPQSAYWRF